MKHNVVIESKTNQKQQIIDTNKITKLLFLAVSGESVETLSYNCHNNSDHLIATNHLSRWLELRRHTITSYSYNMLGLKSSQLYNKFDNTENSTIINNNQDLLLDYKSYVTAVGEYESSNTVALGKNSRPNSHTKLIDNDTEDKKNKSLRFNKDSQDSFIERKVKNTKQQRRTGEIIIHNTIYYINYFNQNMFILKKRNYLIPSTKMFTCPSIVCIMYSIVFIIYFNLKF